MTRFIIARPKEKANKTVAHFKQNKLKAIALPIINVEINSKLVSENSINATPKYCFDSIIITSTFAVDWLVHYSGFSLINIESIKHIVFVGESTANKFKQGWKELSDVGKLPVECIVASPANSEGVLQADCFGSCKGSNIGLLKGKGGRGLIENTLSELGANMTVLDVYERIVDTQALDNLNLNIDPFDYMIATSVEIVDALFSYYDNERLRAIIWIVPSKRIKEYANCLGATRVFISKSANEHDLATKSIELANKGV